MFSPIIIVLVAAVGVLALRVVSRVLALKFGMVLARAKPMTFVHIKIVVLAHIKAVACVHIDIVPLMVIAVKKVAIAHRTVLTTINVTAKL